MDREHFARVSDREGRVDSGIVWTDAKDQEGGRSRKISQVKVSELRGYEFRKNICIYN